MPELTINDVRPEVKDFAVEMGRKLRMNDHKPHWSGSDYPYLRGRLSEEVEEMDKCGHTWMYCGGSQYRTTCPACYITVYIDKCEITPAEMARTESERV